MQESTLPTQHPLPPLLPIPRLKSSTTPPATNVSRKQNPNVNKRSCDQCRKRKVRCDSNIQFPCSSCRKVGVTCFISRPKKTGPPTRKYTESLEKRVQILEELLEKERKEYYINDDNGSPTVQTSSSPAVTVSTQTEPLNETAILPSQRHHTNTINCSVVEQQYDTIDSTTGTISSQNQECCQQRQHLRELVQDIPNLAPELAERMIAAYFEIPHTKCPLIDKRSFLIQLYYQYPQAIDKHLFYAVCSVGCQFLPRTIGSCADHAVERSVGRHLREMTMNQVKGLAFQRSSISTIQTLLLMSMLVPNSNSGEEAYTNWLILGAAIRMSEDLELYSDPRQQHLSKNETEVRKRIAYFLYVLDKLYAAASGKKFAIKDADFNVGDLPSVYEIEPNSTDSKYPGNNNGNDIDNNDSHERCRCCITPTLLQQTEMDIREKRPLYAQFLEIIILSRMVGHVLTSFYMPHAADFETVEETAALVSNVDTAIATWQVSADESYSFRDKAMLHIVYNGLLLLRYRPLLFALTNSSNSSCQEGEKINDDTASQQLQLLNVCSTAAANILDWVDTHPNWGIPFLKDYTMSQAATIFLHNCNSQDEAVRLKARQNLARCANLYKRDDIVNQCQNAIVLRELAKQLSDEYEEKQNDDESSPSSFLEMLLQEGQIEQQRHNRTSMVQPV